MTFSASNGQCVNGWTQYDVWYVSSSTGSGYALPEIYYQSAADEWTMIGLHGIDVAREWWFCPVGPLDEYSADPSTLTPDAAWAALQSD